MGISSQRLLNTVLEWHQLGGMNPSSGQAMDYPDDVRDL
jgi:hypothetical protein